MLEDFFELNRTGGEDEVSKDLFYHEMPQKYTFDKKKGRWQKRKKKESKPILSRIYTVFPS